MPAKQLTIFQAMRLAEEPQTQTGDANPFNTGPRLEQAHNLSSEPGPCCALMYASQKSLKNATRAG